MDVIPLDLMLMFNVLTRNAHPFLLSPGGQIIYTQHESLCASACGVCHVYLKHLCPPVSEQKKKPTLSPFFPALEFENHSG